MPLIVAGPLVNGPDRVVSHMVNIADLYALFGEIAGIEDVHGGRAAADRLRRRCCPTSSIREQASIRTWNFTQIGTNLQADGAINGPCTIGSSCTQIPVSKSVCEDNNGTWWGAGHDAPAPRACPRTGFTYCCQVNAFLARQGQPTFNITPLTAVGIRNGRYKIVQNYQKAYDLAGRSRASTRPPPSSTRSTRRPRAPARPGGHRAAARRPDARQQQNYDALSAQLAAILASAAGVPGDGNIDLVVNQKDLDDWAFYADSTGSRASTISTSTG